MRRNTFCFWVFFLFCPFLISARKNLTNNLLNFRVVFEYTQIASKSGKTIAIIDTMSLDVSREVSVYYDRNLEKRDSMNSVNFMRMKSVNFLSDEQELQSRLEIKESADDIIGDRVGETSRLIKNRVKNELITLARDENDLRYKFKVVESLIPEWDVLPDTATILNYSCIKANTNFRGRSFTAWFSMELPVNDGPWKFYGLPGMILFVEDSEQIFSFKAIGLEKIEEIAFDIYDSHIEIISSEQFKKLRQNQFKKVSYGFYEGATSVTYFYNMNNPITYPEIEISE